MDLENPREASFYNLDGESFSHSAQMEFAWTPARRWDVRLAYRWLDVRTQFSPGLLSKPFINEHRGFANIAYETKENDRKGKWKFDLTANAVGPGRLPSTTANPEEFRLDENSDSFVLLNAQITRVFSERFDLYLGGENLNNYRQPRPILAADQPFSQYFDASMVWGPIFGRMVYAGLRWKIE
jgi:outer membrane receptor protein involved in Fe transport